MKPDACKIERITDDCYDAHSGQDYCHILAYNKDDKLIGYIDYSIFENTSFVDCIETHEQCRRKGIASSLMKKLEKDGRRIKIGLVTPTGKKFFNTYRQRRHTEKYFKPLDTKKNQNILNENIQKMRYTDPERYKDYMKARKKIMPWPEYRRKWTR